jgi:hypothetical protein
MDSLWIVWRLDQEDKPQFALYTAYTQAEGVQLITMANYWFQAYKHKLVAYRSIQHG